jgi:hypothetical protein
MRRLFLPLALALSLSAVSASSALAEAPEGAQKAPLYGPAAAAAFGCESGVLPTPETFGFVVLNTPGDETTVSAEVALKHAQPNTEYRLFVAQDTGPVCPFSFAGSNLTTNTEGNGNLYFTVERVPTATKFWVGIEGGSQTYGSPAVELD